MNNEESLQGSPKGEPGPPCYDNYGGSKDKLGVFMEMKKFKQCFERRPECVY